MLLSFGLVVIQERAELTRVHVVDDGEQELLVELEHFAVLLHDLPHAVDELQEYGRAVLVRVFIRTMSHSLIIYEQQKICL